MADKKDDKKKAPEAPVAGEEGEPKKKSKLLFFVMIAVGALILIGGSVGATLFFTGFFDPKPVVAETAGEQGEGGKAEGEKGEGGEKDVPGGTDKDAAEVPEKEKFEATYKPIERDFTVNVPNSKKFAQFRVAYKTFYGTEIVDRVTKHQIAVEAAIFNTAGQFGEEEMVAVEGRARMATALRDAMNDVLIRNEDFGGIEEVMFTAFVFQ